MLEHSVLQGNLQTQEHWSSCFLFYWEGLRRSMESPGFISLLTVSEYFDFISVADVGIMVKISGFLCFDQGYSI